MTPRHVARMGGVVLAGLVLVAAGCGASASQPSQAAAPKGSTQPASAAPAAGAAQTPQSRLQSLYAQAKQEHQIVFHIGTADYKQYIPLFEKAYPGITVKTIAKTAPEMETQVIAEGSAKRSSVDVVVGNMLQLLPVAQRGLVAPYDWKSLGVNPADVSSDDNFVWLYDFPFGMAYNNKTLPSKDVPTSWDQLLQPQWSGHKIAVHAVEPAVTGLFYSLGPTAAKAYMQKLAKQQLVVENAGYAIRDLILNGQVLLGDQFIQSVFRKMTTTPLRVAPLGPSIVLPFGAYVTKYAPDPAAAKLFLAWMVTSPQAQALSTKLKYMRAKPCSASPLAQLICNEKIKVVYIDTPSKVTQLQSYMKTTDHTLHPGL